AARRSSPSRRRGPGGGTAEPHCASRSRTSAEAPVDWPPQQYIDHETFMRVGRASSRDTMIIAYREAVAVRTPLILVAAAIATCCAGGGLLAVANALSHHSSGTSALSSGSTLDSGPPTPVVPGLETAVRDGKFEFVVHSMECGQSRV